MQPNSVFASLVDRKPYERLSNEELNALTARSSTTGSIGRHSNPFKNKKNQVSNLMFGTRDDSVELMMQNSTSLASSSRKKPSGDVIINE